MEKEERRDNIPEIRSEKVRNVIGEVPRGLVVVSGVVIALLGLAIVLAFMLVPSPDPAYSSFGKFLFFTMIP